MVMDRNLHQNPLIKRLTVVPKVTKQSGPTWMMMINGRLAMYVPGDSQDWDDQEDFDEAVEEEDDFDDLSDLSEPAGDPTIWSNLDDDDEDEDIL